MQRFEVFVLLVLVLVFGRKDSCLIFLKTADWPWGLSLMGPLLPGKSDESYVQFGKAWLLVSSQLGF